MVGLQSLDLPIGVRIPASQRHFTGNQTFDMKSDYPLIISVLSIINDLIL